MACALPHTDSEVELNEDKGRQDVLLNLAFQFKIHAPSGTILEKLMRNATTFLKRVAEAAQLEKTNELVALVFRKNTPPEHTRVFVVIVSLQRSQFRRSEAHCLLCLNESCQSHFQVLYSGVTSSCLVRLSQDAGLPSEKVMASGKNGDDGDLLLFRDGPAPVQVIGLPERLASRVFLEWDVPWRLPVPGSCQTKGKLVINDIVQNSLWTLGTLIPICHTPKFTAAEDWIWDCDFNGVEEVLDTRCD
ncbi:hypothetical protein Tco_0040147 [Tanacetum coccineum]